MAVLGAMAHPVRVSPLWHSLLPLLAARFSVSGIQHLNYIWCSNIIVPQILRLSSPNCARLPDGV
jgi:hypothetical protein